MVSDHKKSECSPIMKYMEYTTPLISTIVAAIGLAFILGMIANKLHMSPLIGYLIAGVCLGPGTPGFTADMSLAHQLAEIGVILLMFSVGLHFSWNDLNQVKLIAIPGAIAQIVIATLLGLIVSWVADWPMNAGLLFGITLSVASTVVLIRALSEKKIVRTQSGKIAISWLLVEDLFVVIVLVILPAFTLINTGSTHQNLLHTLSFKIIEIIAFILLMFVVGKRVIPWALQKAVNTKSEELFRLSVLAIALCVAYGAAKLFGVSFALGAFFAGMMLSESELGQKAAFETLPLRDVFSVLFFVAMGMLMNPKILITEPLLILATVMTIILGKSIVAYIIMIIYRYPKFTALTIAVSLAQIGEFSFILAELGVKLNILTAEIQDIILSSAIISILINPLLFNLLMRLKEKVED